MSPSVLKALQTLSPWSSDEPYEIGVTLLLDGKQVLRSQAQIWTQLCGVPDPTLLRKPHIFFPPSLSGLHCLKGHWHMEAFCMSVLMDLSLSLALLSLFWSCFITAFRFNTTSFFYRVEIRCRSRPPHLKTHQSKRDQPGETAIRAVWWGGARNVRRRKV